MSTTDWEKWLSNFPLIKVADYVHDMIEAEKEIGIFFTKLLFIICYGFTVLMLLIITCLFLFTLDLILGTNRFI